MTTNITIKACNRDDIQVDVHIADNTPGQSFGDKFSLVDGETRDVVIYDNLEVSIKEVARIMPASEEAKTESGE